VRPIADDRNHAGSRAGSPHRSRTWITFISGRQIGSQHRAYRRKLQRKLMRDVACHAVGYLDGRCRSLQPNGSERRICSTSSESADLKVVRTNFVDAVVMKMRLAVMGGETRQPRRPLMISASAARDGSRRATLPVTDIVRDLARFLQLGDDRAEFPRLCRIFSGRAPLRGPPGMSEAYAGLHPP